MSNSVIFDEVLFRAQCPAFSDDTKYPTVLLQMYWDEVGCFIKDGGDGGILNGACTQLAVNWLVAHFLELAKLDSKTMTSKQGGFKTGAGVDKVNVQYLAPPSQDQYSWWLNNTNYGARLAALLDSKAVGGTHVGGMPERQGFRKIGGVFR